MKSARGWTAVLLLGVAAIFGFRALHVAETPHHSAPIGRSPAAASIIPGGDAVADLRPPKGEHPRILTDWAALKRWLDSDPKPDADQIRERLLSLRTAWVAMDPHTLATTLGGLLESGENLQTGMLFDVGPHGMLNGWPSLRVFLLDALALADPELAAEFSREVLSSTRSADEYAVALRSLTRDGLGRAENTELLSHFQTMISRPDWHGERSFAEAMDMTRFLGSTEAARTLLSWQGDPQLKAMALHEFTAEHPAGFLAAHEAATGLDPANRAYLMARAQASDEIQIAAIERYIRDPGLDPEEAKLFFNVYPFRSASTGHRLYGKTPSPFSQQQIEADDKAAYQKSKAWLEDPSLETHRPAIIALRNRLAEWIAQAE